MIPNNCSDCTEGRDFKCLCITCTYNNFKNNACYCLSELEINNDGIEYDGKSITVINCCSYNKDWILALRYRNHIEKKNI